MHIVLDANVLIADPWLKSQRLRVLLDYAAKTRSRLILLETVEREVAAHVQRQFVAAADAIASSLRQAERVGLAGVPAVDAPAMVRDTLAAWEAAFRRALNRSVADRVPTEPAIMPELVRRAAYRLPPVRPNGRETRDTILWLALVAFLKGRRSHEWCAFISQNTEDFAAADGVSLRSDLVPDLVGVPGTFTYYPSVDAFLKEHAEPIRHVTHEWVLERLDLARIRAAIDERLIRTVSPERFVRVVNQDYHDWYEPVSIDVATKASVTLDDVYVYEFEPEFIEVFLDFAAEVEVDAECHLVSGRGLMRAPDDDRDGFGDPRLYRSLTCAGELRVSFAAQIRGEVLHLGDIEDLERL